MTFVDQAKPLPIPDEASAPFFEGARHGTLMLRRCRTCSHWMWPAAPYQPLTPRCRECFSDELEWAAAAGKGMLYTFAIVHQVFDRGFADDVPYNLAVVELEEGPRMTSTVVGPGSGELVIGMPLEAVFEQVSEEIWLPKFARTQC